MKHPIAVLVVTAICASIAACSGNGNGAATGAEPAAAAATAEATPAAPATPAPGPAQAAEPVITKDSPIWFEPASVSTCPGTAPVVGVVHWNASAFTDVTTVQVTMPAGEGKADGMFAVSANVGQKETGPWLAAGTEFVLRDNANGAELARAKMPGAPCQE